VRRRMQLSTGTFRNADAVQRMRGITASILARDGARGLYVGLGPSVLQVRERERERDTQPSVSSLDHTLTHRSHHD
jgi:hypothetical protein